MAKPEIKPEIMCTLTPAQVVGNNDFVSTMCAAGMQSVRINTAHVTSVEQLELLASTLKTVNGDLRILIDTKGPEMRTTAIDADSLTLVAGTTIQIVGTSTDEPTTRDTIHVNYPLIHNAVGAGDVILIDDGKLTMRVDRVDDRTIHATVTTGGILGSRKGLSIADVDVDLPAVSEHDRTYISYAATSPYVDVIAHSFVRSADDVLAVKRAMNGAVKPIIAKIENRQGLDNLDAIADVADGILIARGDLTASIGSENVPVAQQLIASVTKQHDKPLYLATNILPSMMDCTQPSARDIEGIRTAIRQGVDVMLLTNETATGAHPIATVAALAAQL